MKEEYWERVAIHNITLIDKNSEFLRQMRAMLSWDSRPFGGQSRCT
jgi:hypothetical protein